MVKVDLQESPRLQLEEMHFEQSISQHKAQLSLLAGVIDMAPIGFTAHDRLRLLRGDGYSMVCPCVSFNLDPGLFCFLT